MNRRGILALAGTAAAAGLLGGGIPAGAQGAGATPPGADNKVAEVTGFRSARFGMTEKEVREAIVKDFKVKNGDIRLVVNEAERTNVLSVRVPDMIAESGAADVSYVIGYRGKRLIQVGCLWSSATDPAITPAMLRANAQVLAAYFSTAGYSPETVSMNQPVRGGILAFRGSDAQGRMTLLVLHGAAPASGGEFVPTALTLYYTEDPENPDIFKLPPGQF